MAVIEAQEKFYLGKTKFPLGKGIMDEYGRQVKSTAYKTAIRMVTGEDPIVTEYDTYTDIAFTDYQVQFLKDKLTQWDKSEPGEVRINSKPIILPWVVKKYWPWAIGAVVGGYVLGKIF